MVFIKDLQIKPNARLPAPDVSEDDLDDTKVEGTGSGFVWDKYGHIVRFNSSNSISFSHYYIFKFANEPIALSYP